MKIDIIGSQFASRLTEFRSFPYDVNNFAAGQSFLSLLSKPYPVEMKDINTSDIVEISTAHRDLNKANLAKLQESRAEILMIDVLSEMNTLVKYNGSFFNERSFELLDEDIHYDRVRKIDHFKAIKQHMNSIIELTRAYKQVILIDVLPNNEYDDFISGIYELLYSNIEHKLVLSADHQGVKNILDAPIEIYDSIVQQLRKFNSDNYENQLLFDEKLEDDILSVYMNYIEPRYYVYELYKDGQPFKKSHRTDSRYCQFKLDEAGKYRIRVTAESDKVKPRFSETYVYKTNTSSNEDNSLEYIEMPAKKNEWMLKLLLINMNIKGIIGNPYKYTDGYEGIAVYQKGEINSAYIPKENILELALSYLENMDKDHLNAFIKNNKTVISQASQSIQNYIEYLQK